MKECTIKIGNIELTFYSFSSAWISFIKKNYKYFLTQDGPGYKVFLQNNPAKTNIKGLEVTDHNRSYEIKRNDFYSFSEPNFNKTFLNTLRNKYSFDSWLRIFFTLLAIENKGFLLHSSGIYLDPAGTYIFPGVSGKGKSTLIKILGKKIALSDELVYIFKRSGYFYASSTPFWGELKKGPKIAYCARSKGIYFINHGQKVVLNKLNRGESIKKLLKTVMFFSKNSSDIQKLFVILEESAVKTPMLDLYFSLRSAKNELVNKILSGGNNDGN